MNRSFLLALVSGCALAAAQPINVQPPYSVPSTGFIDPTSSTFNGSRPLVACPGSCSVSLINQNIDALQAAIDQANTAPHNWIYIPPGEYPIARGGAAHNQHWGVQLSGYSQIVIRAYGATLRATMDQTGAGGSDYWMINVINGSSNVRIYGLTMSQRDITHAVEQNHMLRLGGTTTADNIQVIDCRFVDGHGGDAMNFSGGAVSTSRLTRVAVANNFIDGARSGITFQHGTGMIDVFNNWFGPNDTDQQIDHEPTSPGGNANENIIANTFTRPSPADGGSSATLISLGGNGGADSAAFSNVFAYNTVNVGSIIGTSEKLLWLVGNKIVDKDGSNTAPMGFVGVNENVWIVNNDVVDQQTWSLGSPGISFTARSSSFPYNVWIRGNRVEQWATTASGPDECVLVQMSDFWVDNNICTYHHSSNGWLGIAATSEVVGAVVRGWITGNHIKRGFQADGVTLAGTIAYGIDFSTGAIPQLGHVVMRDNVIENATNMFLISFAGGSLLEGPPIISGNVGITVANDNMPTSYVMDSTIAAETLATSGAMSPSKPITFVNGDCGSDTDTLADGTYHGERKTIEVYSACVSSGTLTPAHFGDGTSISWTTSGPSPNGSFVLAWDADASKWWLTQKTSIVAINP